MASRAQRICLLIAAVICIAVAVVFFRGSRQRSQSRHQVEAELQIDNARFRSFIENQISSITERQPDGKTATYEVISRKPAIQRLTLTAEKKLTLPDDHGFTELALVSVANNRAAIAYVTVADLGSFGEDKTSVYSGVVTIDVRAANPD